MALLRLCSNSADGDETTQHPDQVHIASIYLQLSIVWYYTTIRYCSVAQVLTTSLSRIIKVFEKKNETVKNNSIDKLNG